MSEILNQQIGGTHYKECKIQPVEFIEANELSFLEGCVIKRLTRHNKETGKGLQDIEKAIHELMLLRELRYNASGLINHDFVIIPRQTAKQLLSISAEPHHRQALEDALGLQ